MSHADHEWAKEQIPAHLAGGLPAEDRARLEAHVLACAECIAEIDATRRFERSLDQIFAPVRPQVGLEERVIRALRTKPSRKPLGVVGKVVASLAAVVTLACTGVLFLEFDSRKPVSDSGRSAESLVDKITSSAGVYAADWNFTPPESGPASATFTATVNQWHNYGFSEASRPASADELARASAGETLNALKELDDKEQFAVGRYGSAERERRPMAPPPPPAVPEPPAPRAEAAPAPAPVVPAPDPAFGARVLKTEGGVEGGLAFTLSEESAKNSKDSYSFRDNAPAKPNYFNPAATSGPAGVAKPVAPKPEPKPEPADPKKPQEAQKPQGQAAQEAPAQQPQRRIIRSGEVEFEIEGFDSTVGNITKIVAEEGGFVATVNSEKLPNGKVRGTVVVRCPPDRLDTLVLKLRGLGELKSQRIGSQDVSKLYTDLESRLRAARAMEERLLRIIKDGKGEIKDLLLAEKELGEWRTKIETWEGEKRYYDNLISLSTLTITLFEKEIRAPFGITQTERVEMGIEVEDVEKAHKDALAAVADAKGRITRSELKQHAAGQFNAIVHFEVAPDASGPVRDRLKQLGTVARLDVNRLQETEGGTGRAQEIKVKMNDAQFQVSLYNLANVQPRETTHLSLACPDAEDAYRKILARVEEAGGRVVTSNLNRQKSDQSAGTILFEVKSGLAEALLESVKGHGEVMNLQTTENPDTQAVTRAKRGFNVILRAMGLVAPRETTAVFVAAENVSVAYGALLDAVRDAKGRVLTSQLNESDPSNLNGMLDFEVRRGPDFEGKVLAALGQAGEIYSRSATRAQDSEQVVDSKTRLQITISSLARIAPRETTTLHLAAKDVSTAYTALLAAVRKAKGWVLVSQLNETDRRNITATLRFDVRRDQEAALAAAIAEAGGVLTRQSTRLPESQVAVDSKVRFDLTLFSQANVTPRETVTLAVEVRSVDAAAQALDGAAAAMGGRTVHKSETREGSGRDITQVVILVPHAKAAGAVAQIVALGHRRLHKVTPHPQAPEGDLAVSRIEVTLSNELIVASDEGPWANIKRGFAVSLKAGSIALMVLMIGVCLVLPLALAGWGGWKVYRKIRPRPAGTP